MTKIKALALYKDFSGCDYHRVRLPFLHAGEYVDNDAFKDAAGNLDKLLAAAELIVFNREFPMPDADVWALKKKHGFKVVLDLDDYWELNPGHYMFNSYRAHRTPEKIVRNIRMADAVTVTTARLALEARCLNKNVYVIPNALPFGQGQFICPDKNETTNFTFIYAGQKSHLHDLKGIRPAIQQFIADDNQNISFALAGYQEGDNTWNEIEEVFTDGGRLKNYICIPNEPLERYMKVYNNVNAALVPLLNNSFNRYKSNLKLLEAGAVKLPVICQRVAPYSDNELAPVLWVDNKNDWYKHMQYLINNRNAATDLGERLHEYVTARYNLFAWNSKRFELYKQIINN